MTGPNGASRLPLICGKCDADEPVGINVRGVYDGVLFWKCASCGFAWERGGFSGRRAEIAQSYVWACNAFTPRSAGEFTVDAMHYRVEHVDQPGAPVWIAADLTRDGCMVLGSTRDQALITLGQAQMAWDDATSGEEQPR